MSSRVERNNSTRRWLLIAVGWVTYACLLAVATIFIRAYAGKPIQAFATSASWLGCAATWFAATPLLLTLAKRFPLTPDRWLSSLAVHVVSGITISFLLLSVYAVAFCVILDQRFLPTFGDLIVSTLRLEILTYAFVICLIHGVDYYGKYRERERRALQLETKLAQAELQALKMQMHPHFLFNTLNSIAVLIAIDPKGARRMLMQLSDLLRATVEKSGIQEVPLREELEFARNYLEIEQTRFQDRLKIQLEIAPDVLDAQVPNLILQPLLENAIKHGISPRTQTGVIQVSAQRQNGSVRIRVRDNGVGLKYRRPEDVPRGVGIGNTEARLSQLYGAAHKFVIQPVSTGGVEVNIEIPFISNPRLNSKVIK